jgi:hypothetical protein
MRKSNKNHNFYKNNLCFEKYDTRCSVYDTRVYYMISPSPRTSAVIPAQAGGQHLALLYDTWQLVAIVELSSLGKCLVRMATKVGIFLKVACPTQTIHTYRKKKCLKWLR